MSGKTAKLSEIATLNPKRERGTPPSAPVSFIAMADVDAESGSTSPGKDREYADVAKGYTPFRDGDLLVAKITPCFENGKIAQARLRHSIGAGSTEFHVIRPDENQVDRRYLLRFLRQEQVRREGERRMTGSAGQRRVPETFLANLLVPLPSLDEQRRIAAVLDKVDALRAKRRESIALLDDLIQSVFLDMFGDPASNPQGWGSIELGKVSEFYAGASLPSGESHTSQEGGYFLMKVSDMNLTGNETWIKSCQNWSDSPGVRSATCPPGAVVFPKRGAAIGTNKKRITIRPSVLDPNLMAVHPNLEALETYFLYQWFLMFDLGQVTSGSTVPQLNKRDLYPLKIILPPLSLQKKFAERVSAITSLKESHRAHLAHLDELFASLQQRAFRGELFSSEAA